MKILHLSTSDIEGGASRAAYRLHQGLQTAGVTSQMLVRAKATSDRSIIAEKSLLTKLGPGLSGLPLKPYSKNLRTMFSAQWFPDHLVQEVQQINPDIIVLHWVCNGFLQIETLRKFNKPIVWTMHDMWAFTGGCHYTQDCQQYQKSCGACPQLGSSNQRDLSRWILHRKAQAWKDLDLTIVSPSVWLAQCARESSLFHNCRVEVIPNGIDTQQYRPIDRQIARNILHLPQDKKLVLFGSMSAGDPRKGFHLLQSALQKLANSEWRDRIELIVLGATQSNSSEDLEFRCHYLGRLGDDIALALVYAAADVFVAPSTQENLPNTVMEALACGVPSVAFNIGGLPDMIEHEKNGYLATPFQDQDLAQGITWIVEDQERYQKLSHRARQKVEQEFSLEIQSRRYLALASELLQQTSYFQSSHRLPSLRDVSGVIDN